MDDFILQVINIHNLGSNKKNHTKFLETLRQVESINENQEIYRRTEEGIDNEEIYRFLRTINSNEMNNNTKFAINRGTVLFSKGCLTVIPVSIPSFSAFSKVALSVLEELNSSIKLLILRLFFPKLLAIG